MPNLPFVLRAIKTTDVRDAIAYRDVPTSEEPLPATVEITDVGFVLARDTRVTRVAPETTDDN